ncbi:monovalent cation:proton antiporter family protein [Pseudalkalibacillus caeni]|uniref:Sodium:proton antiporter n=1 Tax=Exobacillus caeni TaxID=2574798 RepID=A0A5R9F835_9BACL|nr:monovalent cation:proton antiporter family protein [Pseudalkalibacillus caeni]TLS37788.1 sodium:proton antiporter [Pseudalkalibacillus caeni]
MEHSASVTSLLIVILVAFIIPILLHRLKLNILPVVVAEIIAGIIIGKSGLNIVEPDAWLEILSTFGFIFLMFLSGLEIDFSVFASKQKKAKLPNGKREPNRLLVSLVIFALVFAVSYILSLLLVWMNFTDNAFFMTLIISTISLGIVVPTLKEANVSKSAIGQTILLIAVIADLATMILLAVFVSFYSAGQGNMWLLLILFGGGILLYFLGAYFRHMTFIETLSKGTIQIDTRAVFTLIIVLVGLSETVGAENILGAFLAGALVSLLSPNPDMVQKLDSFGYGFLIPIFFVMVGVELEIWSLFQDPKVIMLIPLLLIGLFASKLLPIVVLRKWYDWKTVLGSGLLLTSTLSLVIAAAKIGERMEIIDNQFSSALILVAIISCIIAPVLFKKIFPKLKEGEQAKKLAIIGANQMTLPLSLELDPNLYRTYLYHTKQEKVDEEKQNSCFAVEELRNYQIDSLKEKEVFDADILVITTGDDETNADIALFAKEYGTERVIARVEVPHLSETLRERNIDVFSTFFSTKAILKALIESPSVVNIFTKQENALYQINVHNAEYDGVHLRNFPYLGDSIIVRIFRGKDSIVPHGDTELKLGDRLIVTGSKESVDELRGLLSFY